MAGQLTALGKGLAAHPAVVWPLAGLSPPVVGGQYCIPVAGVREGRGSRWRGRRRRRQAPGGGGAATAAVPFGQLSEAQREVQSLLVPGGGGGGGGCGGVGLSQARAAEAQGGGLKGRSQSLVEVAGVKSGGRGFMLRQAAPPVPLAPLSCQLGRLLLLLLLVDAEGVRVLGVLQERPCGWEEAFALLAGEVGRLVTCCRDKEGVKVAATESFCTNPTESSESV